MSIARFAARLSCAIVIGFGTTASVAQEFLIDFGPASLLSGPATTPSPDTNGNTWNNLVPGQSTRLKTTTDTVEASTSPLGIRLEALTSFGASIFGDEGLLAPDEPAFGSLAIVSATRDYAFRLNNAGTDIRFRLTDIDPSLTFTLEFLGSTASAGSPAVTRYTITGDAAPLVVTLDTAGNTDQLAVVQGVRPSTGGVIQMRLEADKGEFMYLNALRLRVEQQGPEITYTDQPAAAIADSGGTLSFTATVSTTEPAVTYRWERDGVPLEDDARIRGSATASLTIENAGIDDVGMYRLAATAGSATAYSAQVAGVVRASPLGIADADGNGTLDFFDMIRFLESYEEVGP